MIIAGLCFKFDWMRLWYWYVFFGANFALAFNKVSVVPMTPLWSLAVEEHFYLMWPLSVLFLNKRGLMILLACVLIAEPILRSLAPPSLYRLTPFEP